MIEKDQDRCLKTATKIIERTFYKAARRLSAMHNVYFASHNATIGMLSKSAVQ